MQFQRKSVETNFLGAYVTCMYINSFYNGLQTLNVKTASKNGVIQFSLTLNSWQAKLLPSCTAKHKVKSGVNYNWKESFMGCADWCIPAGSAHSLLWRERFDFGVTIKTIPLPNIFNWPSVLSGISEVKWCTISLMVYTFAVLVKSHWFLHFVHNISRIEKTYVFVLVYVLTRWGWRVLFLYCSADQIPL